MVVRNGKKFTFPIYDPSFAVGGLAFRAVPVAAGVVADSFLATAAALGDMAAQSLCPAQR